MQIFHALVLKIIIGTVKPVYKRNKYIPFSSVLWPIIWGWGEKGKRYNGGERGSRERTGDGREGELWKHQRKKQCFHKKRHSTRESKVQREMANAPKVIWRLITVVIPFYLREHPGPMESQSCRDTHSPCPISRARLPGTSEHALIQKQGLWRYH